MTREELEAANEAINDDIRAKIDAKNDLELEINQLRQQRLENIKQINCLLHEEIAALETEV